MFLLHLILSLFEFIPFCIDVTQVIYFYSGTLPVKFVFYLKFSTEGSLEITLQYNDDQMLGNLDFWLCEMVEWINCASDSSLV